MFLAAVVGGGLAVAAIAALHGGRGEGVATTAVSRAPTSEAPRSMAVPHPGLPSEGGRAVALAPAVQAGCASGQPCDAASADALPKWFSDRKADPDAQTAYGAYGDAAEVKRVRENYYCYLAQQARATCEKVERNGDHQKRCLNITLYYSYSQLCGRQP